MRPVRIIKSKALGFFTQVSGVHDSCKETGIMRIKKTQKEEKLAGQAKQNNPPPPPGSVTDRDYTATV